MTVDYFPHSITKKAFTQLSCRHVANIRVKYHKMNTIIQDEIGNKILHEHHLELSNPTATTSPGLVLLPTPLNNAIFPYPCLKQFQDLPEFVLHLTCNHRCMMENTCPFEDHTSFCISCFTHGFIGYHCRCTFIGIRTWYG